MGPGLRELQQLRLIDLSLPISPTTAEPGPPKIDYVDHRAAAIELAAVATRLVGGAAVITESAFTDHLGMANENMQLDSHAGTHMDAPWHFGPWCDHRPARTIDLIPLEWCFGPGVLLDLRHKKSGETITAEDLQLALHAIGYILKPRDIVLLMTGADKHFTQNDYFSAHPGMGREATLWLLDQGIKVIGIDAWGFDRPAGVMLKEYLQSHDSADILPAHMVGRDREYCHIEKLGNLDQIPMPHGFWISCFPVKIERGSAGWLRAVAMIPEDPL